MKTAAIGLLGLLVAVPASAQSEAALRTYFEGKTVVVRLDMPATSSGVDVYPQDERPIDFTRYGDRLKLGIALKSGESIVVTRVRLHNDRIEFHLGGGGYADTGGSSTYVPSVGKSSRERELERLVRDERDAARRRTLQTELDGLRRDREREERDATRARAAAAAADEVRKQRVAEQRLHAGSRFNLRYKPRVPAELTPDDVMDGLREYLEFPWIDGPAGAAAGTPAAAASPGSLRKGMSLQEAETLLGKPEQSDDRMEGTLKVTTAVFTRDDQRIQAEFVEGVLIRYSISSR